MLYYIIMQTSLSLSLFYGRAYLWAINEKKKKNFKEKKGVVNVVERIDSLQQEHGELHR